MSSDSSDGEQVSLIQAAIESESPSNYGTVIPAKDEAVLSPLVPQITINSVKKNRIPWEAMRRELHPVIQLGVPLMVVFTSAIAMNVTDMSVVGHVLGNREPLSWASMGNTLFDLGYFFVAGAATSIDTLVANAYGADPSQMAGIVQRGVIMLLILTALIMPPFSIWAEPILTNVLMEPASLAAGAARFSQLMTIGLFPFVCLLPVRSWLFAQDVVKPFLLVSLLVLPLNAGLGVLLVHLMGFDGSPIATSIIRWLRAAGIIAFIVITKPFKSETWTGWLTWRQLLKWQPWAVMLRMALGGALMVSLEIGAFNATTIFAGQFSAAWLDAHSVCMGLVALVFSSVPYGISVAASMRIAAALADGRPADARVCAFTCLGVVWAVMAVVSATALACRNILGYGFSSDDQVVEKAAEVGVLMAVFIFIDATQGVLAGVLRGCGRHNFVAAANLVGWWAVGVSCAWVFAFPVGWGVPGIWYGMFIGAGAVALSFVVALWRLDWHQESADAMARMAAAAAAKTPQLLPVHVPE